MSPTSAWSTARFGRKHRCRIVFELDTRMDDGRPFVASKTYTVSLHEKSALHKDLRAWRGHPFSPEELSGFDLERLVGACYQVFITHVESDGAVYGNITAVVKADKGKAYRASGLYQRRTPDGNGVDEMPDFDKGNVDSDSEAGEDDIPF